jgi:hypothetical protein
MDTRKTEVHQVHQLHTAENPIKIQKPTRKIILSLKFCSFFVVMSPLPASSPHHSPPYKSKTTNIMLIQNFCTLLKTNLSPQQSFFPRSSSVNDYTTKQKTIFNVLTMTVTLQFPHPYFSVTNTLLRNISTLNSRDWLFSVMVNFYFSREPPVPVPTSKNNN